MIKLRVRVEGILEAQFGTHIRESSDTVEKGRGMERVIGKAIRKDWGA